MKDYEDIPIPGACPGFPVGKFKVEGGPWVEITYGGKTNMGWHLYQEAIKIGKNVTVQFYPYLDFERNVK